MKLKEKLFENILTVLIVAAIAFYGLFFYHRDGRLCRPKDGEAAMYCIDVGQADATLFIFPDGRTLLCDAGNESDGQTVRSVLDRLGVEKLDFMVLTHAHIDHFGGAEVVLDYFPVGKLCITDYPGDTAEFARLMKKAAEQKIEIEFVSAGSVLADGAYKITVLSPEDRSYSEENSYSAALRAEYGKTSFTVMGDATSENEAEITARFGNALKTDALRVGHHGSKSSTSEEFLKYCSPKAAIISVGKDNISGLPSSAVLSRLKKCGAEIYRTDSNGTVACFSDGENVRILTEKQ